MSSFPAPFIEEAVLAPLYILSSFIKNKVPIGAWVYFWAFYLVPLVYSSVFVPVPYCLDSALGHLDVQILSLFYSASNYPHRAGSPPCMDALLPLLGL